MEPPAPASSKSSNLPLILLAILSFISLSTSTFFAYQYFQLKQQLAQVKTTTTQTETWITYQSNRLQLKFKYPPDWVLQDDPLSITHPDQTRKIAFFYLTEPEINYGINYCQANPEDTNRCQKITIAGKPTVIELFPSGYDVSLPLEKGFLKISYSPIPPNGTPPPVLNESDQEIFRTFLSTLRFLNQAENTDTANVCATDGDCGLNICDCKADLKQNISEKDRICARACPGKPKCVSGQCQLIL